MDNADAHIDFIKIIQLSDTHVFAEDAALFGVDTNAQYQKLITHLGKTEFHDTDLILLTGDISQDETLESYQKLADVLNRLNIPVYWVPGNHDNIENIKSAFSHTGNFFHSRRLTTNLWDFIFLNTKKEGSPSGFLSDEELDALKSEISKSPTKPLAIVMHHHPIKVNTPLIDQYILQNAEAFWEIVTGTNVKLVMCGHVHNDYSFIHNGISVESAPASCFQFQKGTTELTLDTKSGCKIYRFYSNHFSKESHWREN